MVKTAKRTKKKRTTKSTTRAKARRVSTHGRTVTRSSKEKTIAPRSRRRVLRKRKSPTTARTHSDRSQTARVQTEPVRLFEEEHIEVMKTSRLLLDDMREVMANRQESLSSTLNRPAAAAQTQHIRITYSDRQRTHSPHVVDLKNQEFFTERFSVRPHRTMEERMADWDEKISHVKTNFITPEAVRSARQNRQHRPGKIRRSWLLLNESLSSRWRRWNDGMSRWSEQRAESYLHKLARVETDEYDDQSLIATAPVSPTRTNQISLVPRELSVSLVTFLVLALALVIPVKAFTLLTSLQTKQSQVLGASTTAYQEMSDGLTALGDLNFAGAGQEFTAAGQTFSSVNGLLSDYPPFLLSLAEVIPSVGKQVSAGRALIRSGNNIAAAGAILSQAIARNTTGAEQLTPTDQLGYLHDSLVQVSALLTDTHAELADVSAADLPSEYRERFDLLKTWLPTGLTWLEQGIEVSHFARDFLGAGRSQRYLFVFQNDNELRPTGGFIGTVAEADVYQGKLTRFYLPPGGVYDLQGNLKVLLASPEPLRILNANWQLQDANWFFDFPTSAQKLMWFYEKSGGPTVDGVVAVNASLLPRLLAITGPIKPSGFDVTLTADNVIDELQREIELDYDRDLNQPKKIIAAALPLLLTELQSTSQDKFLQIFAAFAEGLQQRDIQLYHRNEALQTEIIDLGYGGEIKQTAGDYLAIVNTNIGGGKADGQVSQRVDLKSTISFDGSIVNTLQISRTHHGSIDDELAGTWYRDFVRIYVPEGSQLLKAEGFTPPLPTEFNSPSAGYQDDQFLAIAEGESEVDRISGTRVSQQFGKTVFANWLQLGPGQSQTVTLQYRLPGYIEFKDHEAGNMIVRTFDKLISALGLPLDKTQSAAMYTLYIQDQSGQNVWPFTHELTVPSDWQITTSKNLQAKVVKNNGRVFYQNDIKTDSLWGVILSR